MERKCRTCAWWSHSGSPREMGVCHHETREQRPRSDYWCRHWSSTTGWEESKIQTAESTLESYGVDFDERELRINRSLDFDSWDELRVYLARFRSSSEWWVIDWILYGLDRFGEAAPSARAFTSAVEREGWQLAPKTVQNYISIGRKFPPERRTVGSCWRRLFRKNLHRLREWPTRSAT